MTLASRPGYFFGRPSSLWGRLMRNALNDIAIVFRFRMISIVTGFSEMVWQVIITLAIIISTWYNANYFAALEARRDKRRSLLLVRVVITILSNFIHLGGGQCC